MDSLLEPYLAASGEATEQHLEDLLVKEAEPLIRKVVLRKLGPSCPDLDDICGDVLAEAAARLRQWKLDSAGCHVESFASYVAVAAFNASSEYLRRKFPRWRGLRDRIHYMLRHDARLAIWESPLAGWLCGPAESKGADAAAQPPAVDACADARRRAHADSLLAVFRIAGGPLELDALVDLAAELWGEELDRRVGAKPGGELHLVTPPVEDEIDQRRYAAQVWKEIVALPLRQRLALLLNMKADGADVFLLFAGVSFRAMAAALEMPAEEFAALWGKLPLDDNAIAARLALTRQQVINLRKSARKRLANRIAGGS
jgi:hypothetical protein